MTTNTTYTVQQLDGLRWDNQLCEVSSQAQAEKVMDDAVKAWPDRSHRVLERPSRRVVKKYVPSAIKAEG
jgi:hypothetical protein